MRQAFQSTRWSVVLRARDGDERVARDALEALCRAYWQPLYAFVRRRGHDPEEAADLVQSYFARFLEKDFLHSVDREGGLFRSFLLVSLKHFLLNEWDRTRAQKRGGGVVHVSITPADAEASYAHEPVDGTTPEREFERCWALTVLAHATAALRGEHERAGDVARFDGLVPFLTGDESHGAYRAAGERLGMSEGAVKVAVHRLRKRFGERLRDEIAETVSDPGLVDDEIRHLLRALT